MTVRTLLNSLDSAELTEWMAFESLEAFGDSRADLRMGILASTVANYGGRELKQHAKPADFMPYLQRDEVEEKPVLLADKDKQSALIMKLVFNRG
jgi:hypothetical protein